VTGFVGGRLAASLTGDGWDVHGLVRDRTRARALSDRGVVLHEGDVLDPTSLRGAGEGADVAYYLVHSMGRGGEGDFEDRERRAARNFAEMTKRENVGQVVYLGGLGDRPKSKHLRSRQRTAEILQEFGPPLTYFRAGMVVGPGSESYRTLRYLVQRLPAMIAPAWLATPTQPIAIDDVISYLAQSVDVAGCRGREVQIGGPDVLSYGEMLDRMAEALGLRPRSRVPVPLLTPWLSSLWIGLVTPVDAAIARPLVEGLSTPTTVTDPSGAELFDVTPMPFIEALRRALNEDPEMPSRGTVGVRLLPGDAEPIGRSSPITAVQSAEVLLPIDTSATVNRKVLEQAASAYWRSVTRASLGLIRVRQTPEHEVVALLARPVVLIRFHAARYELSEDGGSVTWPIEDGLLVAHRGVDRGFLRLSIERMGEGRTADLPTLRATMEVQGFFPSLRGRGRLAGAGTWLYGATQHRIHRVLTRGFLRSLGKLSFPTSPAGHTEPR